MGNDKPSWTDDEGVSDEDGESHLDSSPPRTLIERIVYLESEQMVGRIRSDNRLKKLEDELEADNRYLASMLKAIIAVLFVVCFAVFVLVLQLIKKGIIAF